MANKRVQVSDDGGSTFFTLPGNQGEKREELATVDDTIFGANYESGNPTLAQWNVSANGVYKGVAGYNAKLMGPGTPTSMAAEALTLVSGKTYRITAATKRMLSLGHTITVYDNAVDATAEVASIDYLTGTVTFDSGYTVTGPVTLDGYYIPMTQLGKARSFSLTQTKAELDNTTYEAAQTNGGYRTFDPAGLKTANLEIGSIFLNSTIWLPLLRARSVVYVECDLDISDPGKTMFRGFYRVSSHVGSGNQGALEEETIQMTLYAPDGDLIVQPFGWYIESTSRLNIAIKKALLAWSQDESINVRYLPDGVNGFEGEAIITECSLANAVDGQNEFTFGFRGSGTAAAYP